jgi:hypothetical protein
MSAPRFFTTSPLLPSRRSALALCPLWLCVLCVKNGAGEVARMHAFVLVRRPPLNTEVTEAQRTQRKRVLGARRQQSPLHHPSSRSFIH